MRRSDSHRTSQRSVQVGPWRVAKPHPLLWVCLALSVLALVLEVPKGALPTLTGRHKALRVSRRVLVLFFKPSPLLGLRNT